jgi:RES domain-containing protein
VTAREQTHLAEPPDDLSGFPVWHVHAGTTVFRVTRGHGPWWFSSAGGRFDLPPPRGTCYLADDPAVAVLEAFGGLVPGQSVAAADVASRQLWALELPDQCDAADTTVRAARRFGVTAEIGTVTPFEEPQRWAAAWAAAGLDGIRSRARHDPGGGRALALFGAAGERRRWRKGHPQPLDEALLTEAFGPIAVAEAPTSGDLGPLLDG